VPRIRPHVHSVAASISAPAPTQQQDDQPLALAFDDSSRESAAFFGLAIVKDFLEDRNTERSTCAWLLRRTETAFPDANCEYRGRRQLARAHSQKAHSGHTTFACSAEVIDSTKMLYSFEPLCWSGFLWLPAVWPSISMVQSRYVEEPFARKL